MSDHSQGNPDYNDLDLSILTSGSWGADKEEQTSDTLPAEAEAEQASEPNPWAEDEPVGERTPQPPAQPVSAASADDLARVELQPGGIKAAIEAILAVADVPVGVRELSAALIVSERAIEAAIDELYRDYNGYDDGTTVHEPRGYELRRINGGWRLYARAEFSPWVGRFVTGAQTAKLTRAALETLAVVAYQQPVTRSYLAQVRGVSVDAAVRNLKARGLITETVPDDKGATQYITTDTLLEKLGLDSLDQLPALAPYLPDPQDVGNNENLDLATD